MVSTHTVAQIGFAIDGDDVAFVVGNQTYGKEFTAEIIELSVSYFSVGAYFVPNANFIINCILTIVACPEVQVSKATKTFIMVATSWIIFAVLFIYKDAERIVFDHHSNV